MKSGNKDRKKACKGELRGRLSWTGSPRMVERGLSRRLKRLTTRVEVKKSTGLVETERVISHRRSKYRRKYTLDT